MPYWRHEKGMEAETGEAFDTAVAAREGINPKTHLVTFIATGDENAQWHARESDRFDRGEYIHVPWHHYVIYGSSFYSHFSHLSISHPGLITYTKSDEHGVQDRQTRIKPGRYLAEYYSEHFTSVEIEDYIAKCKADNLKLKIARTADEITAVYKGNGPRSCMSPGPRMRTHPCAVYGDSDLAVAYLGDLDDTITARSVIWPEKKTYVRPYGDVAFLRQVLRSEGYTQGSSEGARVRLIERNDAIIMPYVDGISHGSIDGKWIVLDNEGDVSCEETTGYARAPDCDENDDEDSYVCDHCERDYNRRDEGDDTHCGQCLDNMQVCDSCHDRGWNDLSSVGDEYWCESCIDHATISCAYEYIRTRTEGDNAGAGSLAQCEETWIEQGEFTDDEHEQRERLHVTHLCREHACGRQICRHCDVLFDDDGMACPSCGLSVRCTNTYNLFVHFERPYIEIVPVLHDCTPLEESPF